MDDIVSILEDIMMAKHPELEISKLHSVDEDNIRYVLNLANKINKKITNK